MLRLSCFPPRVAPPLPSLFCLALQSCSRAAPETSMKKKNLAFSFGDRKPSIEAKHTLQIDRSILF